MDALVGVAFVIGFFTGVVALWKVENRSDLREELRYRRGSEERASVSRREQRASVLDLLQETMPSESGPLDGFGADRPVGSEHPAGPPPPTPEMARKRKDPLSWMRNR